jgi:S1-C subfamily serine protease
MKLQGVALFLVLMSCVIQGFAKEPPKKAVIDEAKKLAEYGKSAFAQNEYEKARAFYEESLQKFKEAQDQKGQARIAYMLGRCYEMLGDLKNALVYFKMAEVMTDQKEVLEKARQKIGEIEETLKKQEEAEKAKKKTIDIEKMSKATVKVLALGLPSFARFEGKGGKDVPVAVPDSSYGSGVVVSENCVVVTNKHVVQGKIAIAVRFEGIDVPLPATIAYLSDSQDIAFLVVDRESCMDFVGGEDFLIALPERGSEVYKIGYGGEVAGSEVVTKTSSVKKGIVSRVEGIEGKELLEIDAPVNPGDSGGLLADAQGLFVGLVVAKAQESEGVGFAIPAKAVKDALEEARSEISQKMEEIQGPKRKLFRLLRDLCSDLGERSAKDLTAFVIDQKRLQRLGEHLQEKPEWLTGGIALLVLATAWNYGLVLMASGDKEQAKKVFDMVRDTTLNVASSDDQIANSSFALNMGQAYTMVTNILAPPPPPPPPPQPKPAKKNRFEARIGKKVEFYMHWVPFFSIKIDGETKPQLLSLSSGLQFPVAGIERFEFGFGVGYAYLYFKDYDPHISRILLPFRFRYWFLVFDLGPEIVIHKNLKSTYWFSDQEKETKADAGFLLRLGISKVVDLGLQFENIPTMVGRLNFLGIFFGFMVD